MNRIVFWSIFGKTVFPQWQILTVTVEINNIYYIWPLGYIFWTVKGELFSPNLLIQCNYWRHQEQLRTSQCAWETAVGWSKIILTIFFIGKRSLILNSFCMLRQNKLLVPLRGHLLTASSPSCTCPVVTSLCLHWINLPHLAEKMCCYVFRRVTANFQHYTCYLRSWNGPPPAWPSTPEQRGWEPRQVQGNNRCTGWLGVVWFGWVVVFWCVRLHC